MASGLISELQISVILNNANVIYSNSLLLVFLCLCRKVEGSRAPRDERRRAQHNEGGGASAWAPEERPSLGLRFSLCLFAVERRRRDKINNWIVTLSKIIPDCSLDSRTGAVSAASLLALIEEEQRSASELWHQMEKLLCVLLPWQQQAQPAFPSVAEPERMLVCSLELPPAGISADHLSPISVMSFSTPQSDLST